ncbi:transcriptional regulator GcvA [Caulobacter sp. NIBR1757]|uniref:transcriptional regulator GcvA n=1 Tax=Caulobacter sp. NIBR1757 TaxID=3016000 RepID=UPI0022EFE1A1|nr:transcriptional regulator GcvA [Caulobacter sp. NIBR1757]WGM37635.1 Glycine cleavage system transcriptional activator [Caulobacter sp. NIBR1757]
MRRLPPLSAVRVFEAAARHENFTAAAGELGMTQAAVSHQIRVLEDRLGQKLFRRERQRVILTEAGRRAALRAGRGLDEIEAAFAELRAEDDGALTISTTVTFANTWLAWRLGRFQVSHPDIAVRLSADNHLTDFAAGDIDVAIRLGDGNWPELATHRLVTVDFTPMCSPGFLAAHGGTIALEDLPSLPLISPAEPSWTQWLHEAGLSAAVARPLSGVHLDTQANEGHAAMAGQGIAILTPFLWRQDMADGRLTQLFPQTSTLGQAFWLVYPEHRRRSPKIRRFRDWLEAEVKLTLASLQT